MRKFLISFLFCTLFLGCSDDNSPGNQIIVGTWGDEVVTIKEVVTDNDKATEALKISLLGNEPLIYTFTDDGHFVIKDKSDYLPLVGTYKLEGNTLTLNYGGEFEGKVFTYEISLSANTLSFDVDLIGLANSSHFSPDIGDFIASKALVTKTYKRQK